MRAFTVAQLAGIDIVVHRLWALWFVGLAAVLAQVTFPEMIRGWSAPAYWVLAVAVVLGENAGGLVHELGHALMALAHRRHVHSITLYGFAAATRRTTCPSDAREQFLVALAGPLSHLLLAAGFCALFQWLPTGSPLCMAAGLLMLLNLGMSALNLLPVGPLDGRRAAVALSSWLR